MGTLRSIRDGMVVLFVLALASSASAHPDYESDDQVVLDEAGRPVHVSKHFTDGIVLQDMVKLVVRDAAGATLAETAFGDDVCVVCWRQGECLVFRYDGAFSPFPDDVWQLHGSELRSASSGWLPWAGLLVPYWDHLGDCLVMFVVLLLPVAGIAYLSKIPDGFNRKALFVACGFLAGFALLALVVFALTWRPSVAHRVAFLAITAAAGAWLARASGRAALRYG
jgi:hypothetical protein